MATLILDAYVVSFAARTTNLKRYLPAVHCLRYKCNQYGLIRTNDFLLNSTGAYFLTFLGIFFSNYPDTFSRFHTT